MADGNDDSSQITWIYVAQVDIIDCLQMNPSVIQVSVTLSIINELVIFAENRKTTEEQNFSLSLN